MTRIRQTYNRFKKVTAKANKKISRKSKKKMATTKKSQKKIFAGRSVRRSSRITKKFVPFTIPAPVKSLHKIQKVHKEHKEEKKTVADKTIRTSRKRKSSERQESIKMKVARKTRRNILIQRDDVEDFHENPLIFSRKPIKFGSVLSYGPIALHRSVMLKDVGLLKKTFLDYKKCAYDALRYSYSNALDVSPLGLAMSFGDRELIDAILKFTTDYKDNAKHAVRETVLLQESSTGTMNIHMLGHATRRIQMTRYGREGNTAFLNYDRHRSSLKKDFMYAVKRNTDFEILDYVKSKFNDPTSPNLVLAVRFGNNLLAARIIEVHSSYSFNKLHIQTLLNTNQPLQKFTAASSKKKAIGYRGITPLHTAAINPNSMYLKALAAVNPSFNVPDDDNWYTIHYASVCSGADPLRFFVNREYSCSILNNNKETPLHCAVRAGRLENVKLLIEAIKKEEQRFRELICEEGDEDDFEQERKKSAKRKISIIDYKTKKGMTALHFAAMYGHEEIVRILIKNEATIDLATTARKNMMTPLMMACAYGHRKIADILIDEGNAKIEKKDKLKRTALMHAVINGHLHILSMLLRRGASVKSADSSANTAAHYAAAYGWYECLELITHVHPSALLAGNSWLLTPLATAYLKGHYGIVDWLLNSNDVKVDCCDEDGNTLLMVALNSYKVIESKDILLQINFLISRGANCMLNNSSRQTPFHIFAALKTKLSYENEENTKTRLLVDEYIELAKMFLCRSYLSKKDDKGDDVLSVALKNNNLLLMNIIVDEMIKAGKKMDEIFTVEYEEKNVLHYLFKIPFTVYQDMYGWASDDTPARYQFDLLPLFKKLISLDAKQIQEWMYVTDSSGCTPYYILCDGCVNTNISNGAEKKHQEAFGTFLNSVYQLIEEIISFSPGILIYTPKREVTDLSKRLTKSSDEENEERSIASSDEWNESDNEPTCRKPNKEEIVVKENPFWFLLKCDDGTKLFTHEFNINSKIYKISNKLLTLVIRLAKNNKLLFELLNLRNAEKFTPLIYALNLGNDVLSLYLLSVQPVVAMRPRLEAATVPVRYDSQKKKFVPFNKSALMYAIENQLFEVINAFVLSESEWQQKMADGNNAFHFAASNYCSKTVDFLNFFEEKGISFCPNNRLMYPLHIAVSHAYTRSTDVLTEPIEWLIRNGKGIHECDINGHYPLHCAFFDDNDSKSQIEPIAVISLLLNLMRDDEINKKDKFGNTVLHHAVMRGSNISLMTLLKYGCDPNAKNDEGNTPLAIASLMDRETCAMSLIQANADVTAEVYVKPKDPIKVYPWTLYHLREPPNELPKMNIPNLVLRNDWQGITYLILNYLGNNETALFILVKAAFEANKYNLAFRMLTSFEKFLISDNKQLEQSEIHVLNESGLFVSFAKSLSNRAEHIILKILDRMFSFGLKWFTIQNGTYRSETICALAHSGNFEVMRRIREMDTRSDKVWNKIEYSTDNSNPLVGIVQWWIKNGPSEEAKEWMHIFASHNGINTLMSYPCPAYDGMQRWAPRKDITVYRKITALIFAIQCRCTSLIKHLLQNKRLEVDINKSDESGISPLMHACIINSVYFIHLLFDPDFTKTTNSGCLAGQKIQQDESTAGGQGLFFNAEQSTSGIGGLFGGFGGGNVSKKTCGEGKTSSEQNREVNLPLFKLRSNLNLFQKQVIDGEATSNTFLHFMIHPCGWENASLLSSLYQSVPEIGTLINSVSSSGKTLLNLVKENRQLKMLKTLKEITEAEEFNIELETIDVSEISVKYNIDEDSENYLKQEFEKHHKKVKELKPHKNSDYSEKGEICYANIDGEMIPYKVLLNRTDVFHGLNGFHNYYRLELIKRKGSELYIVFTNWGRIGDECGQYQRTPFGSLTEAEKEFTSIFRSKTGNDFVNIRNFEEKDGKYRLFNVENELARDIGNLKIEFQHKANMERLKYDSVYEFIVDICNINRLKKLTRKACSNSSLSRCPFGQIRKSDLLEGLETLYKLRDIIIKLNEAREKRRPVEEILNLFKAQVKLNNEFFRLVPIGGFEYTSMNIIDTEYQVKNYENEMRQLMDFEIAGRFITAAAWKSVSMDPYQYILKTIGCAIDLMDSDDVYSHRIMQYIKNTSECHICKIYSITSKKNALSFNEKGLKLPNHRYLWHGTKPENLLSILSEGLMCNAPIAEKNGQAFGEGIYFADVFSKSENYCTSSARNVNYMLLCQVAIGEMHPVKNGDLDGKKNNECDTAFVPGYNDPNSTYDLTMPNGVIFPLGNIIERSREQVIRKHGIEPCTRYNEYVVCDPAHVAIRFLVAFK